MTPVEFPTRDGAAPKSVNHVTIAWAGEHRFDAGRPGGVQVRIDSSATAGPGPVDAVLIALGTCTAVDVVDILAKQRAALESLSMEVRGARANAVPACLIGIELVYHITGVAIKRSHAERAIKLAVDKYCSVRNSLDPTIPITWKLDLHARGEAQDAAD